MVFVSAKQAAKYYQLSEITLRQKARKGEINVLKKETGRYLYEIPDPVCINIKPGETTIETESVSTKETKERKKIIYARVSSKKQENELYHQISYLLSYYPNYEPVADIASGINWDRPGFKRIITLLLQGEIDEVVVAYDDRFSRFGFEFFEWLFQQYNSKLTCINKEEGNDTDEMLGDIMEILTVFTARYHGQRRYMHDNKKNKVLSKQATKKNI
jgi:predicted site-specific integrase-resolvase